MPNGEYKHKVKQIKTVFEHEAVGWRGWSRIEAKHARENAVRRAQVCSGVLTSMHWWKVCHPAMLGANEDEMQ